MKILIFNRAWVIFLILTLSACSPSEVSLDWGDIFNTEKVCFLIKDSNTDKPIEGALIELIGYNTPNCVTCPIDLEKVSNEKGEACMNLTEGWRCDSTKITADGYFPKTINTKPPLILYLTPRGE